MSKFNISIKDIVVIAGLLGLGGNQIHSQVTSDAVSTDTLAERTKNLQDQIDDLKMGLGQTKSGGVSADSVQNEILITLKIGQETILDKVAINKEAAESTIHGLTEWLKTITNSP